MEFTRQDVDQLIEQFRNKPDIEVYTLINNWYENNIEHYPDSEYLVCVYLFLVGANIRHKYRQFTYQEHLAYVKEIRELIENASPLNSSQRKVYLDFGTKSGR